MPKPAYLGDDIYASFDGTYLALSIGSHTNLPVVYLEAAVVDRLRVYANRAWAPVPETQYAPHDPYLDGDYEKTGSKANPEWGE